MTETKENWSKVSYKGMTGWVSGDDLKTAPTSKAKVYNYTTKYTTLRQDASNKSDSLGSLRAT